MLPGARLITALTCEIISIISSLAITIPVLAAGRPSFERLIHSIIFSFQIGLASVKMIFGKGVPYALSTINGILFAHERALSFSISESVKTLPVGLVGRDTHIAPISSVILSWSKSI